MTAVPAQAIQAIAPSLGADRLFAAQAPVHINAAAGAGAPQGASFAQVLLDGIAGVDKKMAAADAQVRAFAVDDSVPLHQVTFALEEARMSLEMMLQVRARMVEGFQQLMGMQL